VSFYPREVLAAHEKKCPPTHGSLLLSHQPHGQ
jgi:hypothetical protein